MLRGTAVSAGLAKGAVRVLTVDSMDELEPGEVLVTAFTDTGWTPFFAYAAAVIVDTGGEMSHAAVVAREFGIPCVVGTLHRKQGAEDGPCGRGRRRVGRGDQGRMSTPTAAAPARSQYHGLFVDGGWRPTESNRAGAESGDRGNRYHRPVGHGR